MSFMKKPKVSHSGLPRNELGLSIRDYEGSMSTLCAGCGHDSVTAALIQAIWELNIQPHRIVKMSGIGCSSKTPAYFVEAAHGINAVHGRMPSIATGANAANRSLHYIGISGDGDSLSIGLGQFVHALRRNINMLYLIENNGVYGLTKGQFSASADQGSTAKKGEVNRQPPIDPVTLALALGGSFIARGFSGDKDQLVPLIKAGLMHNGFALLDVLSPCVTFNDHEGSTKSYAHTRHFDLPAAQADFIPRKIPIQAVTAGGEAIPVALHDGSTVILKKVAKDYNPMNREEAYQYIQKHRDGGEIVTGLLYINEDQEEFHALNDTISGALRDLPYPELCPGAAVLEEIQQLYR